MCSRDDFLLYEFLHVPTGNARSTDMNMIVLMQIFKLRSTPGYRGGAFRTYTYSSTLSLSVTVRFYQPVWYAIVAECLMPKTN